MFELGAVAEENRVFSQSSTIVQISHQMFLIQAQNLLSCPQGKSGSMLFSIAALALSADWAEQAAQ